MRTLIVGGGCITMEFASIFNGLVSLKTLANRGDLPLRGRDDNIRKFIVSKIAKKGAAFSSLIAVS